MSLQVGYRVPKSKQAESFCGANAAVWELQRLQKGLKETLLTSEALFSKQPLLETIHDLDSGFPQLKEIEKQLLGRVRAAAE
jgi:hypothetical protein